VRSKVVVSILVALFSFSVFAGGPKHKRIASTYHSAQQIPAWTMASLLLLTVLTTTSLAESTASDVTPDHLLVDQDQVQNLAEPPALAGTCPQSSELPVLLDVNGAVGNLQHLHRNGSFEYIVPNKQYRTERHHAGKKVIEATELACGKVEVSAHYLGDNLSGVEVQEHFFTEFGFVKAITRYDVKGELLGADFFTYNFQGHRKKLHSAQLKKLKKSPFWHGFVKRQYFAVQGNQPAPFYY
jgi:hypothetical protein